MIGVVAHGETASAMTPLSPEFLKLVEKTKRRYDF